MNDQLRKRTTHLIDTGKKISSPMLKADTNLVMQL